MYNEDIKMRFLEQLTYNLSTRNYYVGLFNSIEAYENQLGTDICTFTKEEIAQVVDNVLGGRMRTSLEKFYRLRQYIRWCVKENFPQAHDNISDIEIDRSKKMRIKTIPNPLALKKYLGDVFGDPDAVIRDAKNIYKCYMWLAYGGAFQDEVLDLTESDVCVNDMEFVYKSHTIYLYKESLRVIRNCCGNDPFEHDHGTYSNKMPRAPGDKLLRGRDGVPNAASFKIELSRSAQKARDCGKTDLEISFASARLSGRFYRMYEREKAGYDIDFLGEFATDYKAKKKTQERMARMNAAELEKLRKYIRAKAKDHEEDYLCWKIAHKL